MTDISTCSMSLLHPGTCCMDACVQRATVAMLDPDLVEHTRCPEHADEPDASTKPLVWDPVWASPGRHEHQWTRETVPGVIERAVLAVQPSGVVLVSEALMVQLLTDAGWERTR